MFTSTFTVIYGKIVAATFGREAADRLDSRRTREREREREKWEERKEREEPPPLSERGARLKTPKDSIIYHGAGATRGKGAGWETQSAGRTNRGLTIHILSTIIPRSAGREGSRRTWRLFSRISAIERNGFVTSPDLSRRRG